MENKFSEHYKMINKSYDQLGNNYLEKIEPYPVKEIQDFMDLLPKGSSVLDVGCAGGRDTKIFVDHGLKATGIDINNNFIEIAKAKVPNAKFSVMNTEKLDFADQSFDGIYACAILVHIKKENVGKILNEFRRCLKDHGKLFIAVKEGVGEEYISDPHSGNIKRFMSYFTQEEIRQYLGKTGFKIIFEKLTPDEAKRVGIIWIKLIAEKL